MKLCEENGLQTGDREFSGSLFHEINKPHSTVNLLIGSKKFTEGWSSWRVSTMGLMNVGQGEGSQIIQLFGRGVRLKGYGIEPEAQQQDAVSRRGDATEAYWHVWRRFASSAFTPTIWPSSASSSKKKDCPTNDEQIEFLLPVIKNSGHAEAADDPAQEDDQRREHRVRRRVPQAWASADALQADPSNDKSPEYLQKNQVVLNWYPKIQAMKSGGVVGRRCGGHAQPDSPDRSHVAFLDLDRLYFELERFKAERGWYNLNLTRDGIEHSARGPELVSASHSRRGVGLRLVRQGRDCGRKSPCPCSRSTRSGITHSANGNGSCRIWSTRT